MRRILLVLVLLLGACTPSITHQRLLVVGDWGFDSTHRPLVMSAMRATLANQGFDGLLTLGDNFYPLGEPVLAFYDDLPKTKIYPAFGNHDAPNLDKQLQLFGQAKAYYTVKLGQLEVFVVYSEKLDNEQMAWLENALKASSTPWKVLALHRPLYTSGLHQADTDISPASLREKLEPLIAQHGVRLVLAGHDHEYERLEAGGVVHIVSGGGGADLREFATILPESKVRHVSPNYLTLEALPERLGIKAYNEKNELLDQVEIKR
jgi:acid phosphatase